MKVKGKYYGISDEEMIKLIRDGDEMAVDYLLEKYKGLVKSKARTLFLAGADRDDLIQEGMIGLYKAIRGFDLSKDTSFFNFANLCISRQIYNAINASNRKKNIPLNTYVSLSSPIFYDDDGDEVLPTFNTILKSNQKDPEELVIDKEKATMIEYELDKRLSDLEKSVISLYLKDFNYIEISKILDKEAKAIDNALTRIKGKLSKIISEI